MIVKLSRENITSPIRANAAFLKIRRRTLESISTSRWKL